MIISTALKVWGKVMFSQVSVHREVSASGSRGCLPLSLEAVPLGGSRGTSPLDTHTHTRGQHAVGTHPTGMLSCFGVALPNFCSHFGSSSSEIEQDFLIQQKCLAAWSYDI